METVQATSPDPAFSPAGTAHRLQRWAFSLPPSRHRSVHFFRVWVRIILIMWVEFFRTHLAIRASALTFTILLSLVPILALSTSILKGLGNDEQLKQAALRFIDQLETPILSPHSPPTAHNQRFEPGDAGTSDASPPTVNPATAHLHRAIDIIFQYVDRTNFAALGIIGVLGLIAVVLLVLASIEEAMNVIWHTSEGRPFLRKIMDYMALLILLPLSLNVALAAEAVLANQQIMDRLATFLPSPWMLTLGIKLAPFACIVLTLMTMYLFFPHVKVRRVAALAGAIFAAVFWFVFQKLYISLQIGVANYNAIYGSFASIPLFLIWLHIGWTCILLGASLAYAIQHHRHYHLSDAPLSPQHQLQIALDILRIVYIHFDQRMPTTLALLCTQLPHTRCTDISATVNLLVQGRLLINRHHQDEDQFAPVTAADKLAASEVVRLILGGETVSSPGGLVAAQALEAAINSVNFPFINHADLQQRGDSAVTPDPWSNSRRP